MSTGAAVFILTETCIIVALAAGYSHEEWFIRVEDKLIRGMKRIRRHRLAKALVRSGLTGVTKTDGGYRFTYASHDNVRHREMY